MVWRNSFESALHPLIDSMCFSDCLSMRIDLSPLMWSAFLVINSISGRILVTSDDYYAILGVSPDASTRK
jgi:hypothetical protein